MVINGLRWLFLLPLAVLLPFSGLVARDFPMLHFTNENGLPGNTVYQVYRDHQGFLWFGTDKGVARYNGISFEIFTTFSGLPDNEVFFFSEDSTGRLWLGTSGGELCYYKDDTFHTAANTPLLRLPFANRRVKTITPQSDGSTIISLADLPLFLNIMDDRCQVLDTRKIPGVERFGGLLYKHKITSNRYKFTFSNTIVITDTLMHIRQQFDVDTFKMDPGGNAAMYSSSQDQDYLFSSRALFSAEMDRIANFPPGFHSLHYLNRVFVGNGYRFYATNNGLLINDTLHLLPACNVSSIADDRYGNYWISTLNSGVFVIRKDFVNSRICSACLPGRALYARAVNGELFVTTNGGECSRMKDGTITPLCGSAAKSNYRLSPGVSQAFYYKPGQGYYSLRDHELSFMPVVEGARSVRVYARVQGVRSMVVSAENVYMQRADAIVMLSQNADGSFTAGAETIHLPKGAERIWCMVPDDTGGVYFSASNGLYHRAAGCAATLISSSPFKVFERMGNSIVGYTHQNDLLVLRDIASGPRIDTVVQQNCIWDRLYQLDNEHMLISTNGKYRVLSLAGQGSARGYELQLLDDPFLPLQPDAVASDGRSCYFLKDDDITIFDKVDMLAPRQPPVVFFTTLSTSEKNYTIRKALKVSFGESRNMAISFSVVTSPGSEVIYEYAIAKRGNGIWTEVRGEDVSLVNPGPGNYAVRIRARTSSSQFGVPIKFSLRIARPFWATWWFIVLCIAAVVYAVVIISRRRIAAILARKDREHEMQVRFMKSEYKALNALMNPHFIFNTLNNVQGLINKDEKLAANEYLRVIADLIRQNMHNTSKELIPLQKEIDLISNYLVLEKLRFKDRLNYTIIVDRGLDLTEIMIPPLLIQPLVENSIKHGILRLEGRKGSVYINIYEREDDLYIEVRDNGVGLNYKKSEKLASHESFGLENIKKRIEQLSIIQNKEILFDLREAKDEEGNYQWTVASIIIPLDD